jgi:hypothetical protein
MVTLFEVEALAPHALLAVTLMVAADTVAVVKLAVPVVLVPEMVPAVVDQVYEVAPVTAVMVYGTAVFDLQGVALPVMVPGAAGLLLTARERTGPAPQALFAATVTLPDTNVVATLTEIEVPVELPVMVIPVGTVQV